jgi:hypothetical protein
MWTSTVVRRHLALLLPNSQPSLPVFVHFTSPPGAPPLQDATFAREFTRFVAALLCKAPAAQMDLLLGGLGAMKDELLWFAVGGRAGPLQRRAARLPHGFHACGAPLEEALPCCPAMYLNRATSACAPPRPHHYTGTGSAARPAAGRRRARHTPHLPPLLALHAQRVQAAVRCARRGLLGHRAQLQRGLAQLHRR